MVDGAIAGARAAHAGDGPPGLRAAPYGYADSPVWSPDGRFIAYAWATPDRTELRTVASTGGEPQTLSDKGRFYPADWSPDGKLIAGSWVGGDGKGSLATVSTSRELTELRTWSQATPLSAAFSPDGRLLAYSAVLDGRSRIFLFDLRTKSDTELTRAAIADRLPFWSPDGRTLFFVSERSGRPDRRGRAADDPVATEPAIARALSRR